MQKLKGLKNTLYKELLSGYTLEFFREKIEEESYSIRLFPGKTVISSKDEEGELNALSLLNLLNYSDWKNFEGISRLKKKSRTLFVTSLFSKEMYEIVAFQVKKLGFTHFISKVKDENLKTILNRYGLKYGVLGLEADFDPDFFYHVPQIEKDKETLYAETLVNELGKIETPVWFQVPDQPFSEAILRKLDLHNKRASPLVIPNRHALSDLKKVGSPLHFKINIENPLWPLTTILSGDDYIFGLDRHPVDGLIIETPLAPAAGGFLEMQLWALTQAQIRGERTHSFVESWLKKKGGRKLSLYQVCSEIAKDLKLVSHKNLKVLSSKILSNIQLLEEKVKKERELKIFLLDARKILAYYLQENNIHLPQILRDEDFENSFYAEAYSLGGSFLKTSAKIILKDHSQTLKYEGELKALYFENSLF